MALGASVAHRSGLRIRSNRIRKARSDPGLSYVCVLHFDHATICAAWFITDIANGANNAQAAIKQ